MMRRRRLVSYVPGNKGKERVGALCVSVSLKLSRSVVVRKGEEQQLAVHLQGVSEKTGKKCFSFCHQSYILLRLFRDAIRDGMALMARMPQENFSDHFASSSSEGVRIKPSL